LWLKLQLERVGKWVILGKMWANKGKISF